MRALAVPALLFLVAVLWVPSGPPPTHDSPVAMAFLLSLAYALGYLVRGRSANR